MADDHYLFGPARSQIDGAPESFATIRACTPADVSQLVDLAQSFHASLREIAPADYCETFDSLGCAAMFGEAAASPDFLLAVADIGRGILAGYLWAQLMDRPRSPFSPPTRFLFVYQVFVAPSARRSKVASLLIDHAARFGLDGGAGEIFLDVVDSNRSATAAFRSSGFDQSGILMRRNLGSMAGLS